MLCRVKEGRHERVPAARFHLCEILKRANLTYRDRNQWLPGVGMGKDIRDLSEVTELRWDGGYTDVHICHNSLSTH